MVTRNHSLSTALILAAAFGKFSAPSRRSQEPRPRLKRLPPEVVRLVGVEKTTRYAYPHQSYRERARRIGGDTWAQYKQWDRERRGLPQSKEANA